MGFASKSEIERRYNCRFAAYTIREPSRDIAMQRQARSNGSVLGRSNTRRETAASGEGLKYQTAVPASIADTAIARTTGMARFHNGRRGGVNGSVTTSSLAID